MSDNTLYLTQPFVLLNINTGQVLGVSPPCTTLETAAAMVETDLENAYVFMSQKELEFLINRDIPRPDGAFEWQKVDFRLYFYRLGLRIFSLKNKIVYLRWKLQRVEDLVTEQED
jgi:hypothetical protein